MDYPKVSIVIPIFNRERTLKVCIDSVLNSNYSNWELILVDDGSSDDSSIICMDYAKRYSNIKVFIQENKGVSAARNKGIDLAEGEWITFLDSDDAFLPQHLDIVKNEYNNADLLMTGSCISDYKNNKLIPLIYEVKKPRIYKENATHYFMSHEFDPFTNIFFSIWDKFFRLELIKKQNIRFDETLSLGEDQVFVCDYLCEASSLVYYLNPTHTRVRWENIEHLGIKLRSPKEFLYNQIQSYNALKRLYEVKGGELTEQYATNFGIDRPINRIIYNYILGKYEEQISEEDFILFVKEQIIPFINSIKLQGNNMIKSDILITRFCLLHLNWFIVKIWVKLYIYIIQPLSKLLSVVISRIKFTVKSCIKLFIR